MNNDMIGGLFAALDGIPDLPGAVCRGHDELFDDYDDPDATEYCVSMYKRCPALASCAHWFDSLPAPQGPFGVVAGKVRRPRSKKKYQAA